MHSNPQSKLSGVLHFHFYCPKYLAFSFSYLLREKTKPQVDFKNSFCGLKSHLWKVLLKCCSVCNGYNYQKSVELSLSAQLAPSARARPDLLDDLNIGSHWFTSSKVPQIIPQLKVIETMKD